MGPLRGGLSLWAKPLPPNRTSATPAPGADPWKESRYKAPRAQRFGVHGLEGAVFEPRLTAHSLLCSVAPLWSVAWKRTPTWAWAPSLPPGCWSPGSPVLRLPVEEGAQSPVGTSPSTSQEGGAALALLCVSVCACQCSCVTANFRPQVWRCLEQADTQCPGSPWWRV